MSKLTRIPPLGQPGDYRTYSLWAPLDTHWRVATCAEVDCQVSAQGWTTTTDEATPLGQRQAGYIRTRAGRHYTERIRNGLITVFSFPAGESCFTSHRIRSDRDFRYLRRQGDWRGYGDGMEHTRGADWQEDFAEHQDRIAKETSNG